MLENEKLPFNFYNSNIEGDDMMYVVYSFVVSDK